MNRIWNKKGEGYIDTCVMVVVFVMILVVAINIFSFITLKVDMDEIADELIETAAFTGEFGDNFWKRNEELQAMYFYYDVDYSAEEYFNSALERVQLGDTMTVTIIIDTYIKGLGIFKIPVTLQVTKTQISEKYWK
ncbi:MAG: DUF4320 family protein [Eubacteriales bacterium]|nr:DUF4320 family protein [Eubacteriales bacterium]MDD4474369.1 DUF4320 family protein [Eubacteriales bacterium]